MKRIKTILTYVLVVLLILSISPAIAQQGSKTPPPPADSVLLKERKAAVVEEHVFTAGEYQLEVAGQARTEDLGRFDTGMTFGGAYWPMQGAGFRAAFGMKDLNYTFVDHVEFGPVGRVTFPKFNLALLFGVGAEWRQVDEFSTETRGESEVQTKERDDFWAVYAEAGPVFRVHRNVDIFAKVRGVRPIEGAEHEHLAFIAGISLTGRTK